MTHVRFDTTVAASGNNTGIVVPPDLIDALGAGKRPPVHVSLNGYEYRTTVAVMQGTYMVSVSAAVRGATGLKGGDPVEVTLTLASTPRDVDVPPDFRAALTAQPAAEAFFATLANSIQRFHVDNINGAKSDDTRQRRIGRAVQLFLDGKQR